MPTAISIFSGGGGLDLGLEAAGFSTLFASDIDEHSCLTLQNGKLAGRKRGKHFLRDAIVHREDIRNLTAKHILQELRAKRRKVDLLAGGPPCQAFSVFGRRLGSRDPRGKLVFQYLRLISELQPEVFVFENVYGILTIEGGAIFEKLCDRLARPSKKLKYQLSVLRVNAVDHGVPQFRDRVFVVGHLGGKKILSVPHITGDSPSLFRTPPRWRTVRDALRGLPPIGDATTPNHVGRVHSERIIKRYSGMAAGARDSFTRINKLDLNRPSFTIIVGSDQGGGKGHIHPTEAREVTPRESARIQTFPDWWAFSGTSRHPIRQIGNAVPPLLGAAIGNEIRHQILGLQRTPFCTVLKALDQVHLFSKSEVEEIDTWLEKDECESSIYPI